MNKFKKYFYPFAFLGCFILIYIILVYILNDVANMGFGAVAWVVLFSIGWILFVLPFYCIKYSKVIQCEKDKFLFVAFNSFVITLSYMLPFVEEDETYIYGFFLFIWVTIWTILPLKLRLISAKKQSDNGSKEIQE